MSAQKCRAREDGFLYETRGKYVCYLLAAICSHHLEKSDGADEVVVIVKQGLVHALANSFEPSKVNDSLKPAATVRSGRVLVRSKGKMPNILVTNNSCPGGAEKVNITDRQTA